MRWVKSTLFSYLKLDGQRLTAIASIAILIFAAVGVPFPMVVKKDRSVPFPCMDRACGCRSAAECKKHCCCFSNGEKIAWAKSRRLDPSTIAESSAETKTLACERCQPKSCCSKTISSPCPHGKRKVVAHSSTPSEESTDLVVASFERQCRGADGFWVLLSIALKPPAFVSMLTFDVVTEVVEWPSIDWADPLSSPPPVPPPEINSSSSTLS
jgi:hypothetical protein